MEGIITVRFFATFLYHDNPKWKLFPGIFLSSRVAVAGRIIVHFIIKHKSYNCEDIGLPMEVDFSRSNFSKSKKR
jgi:hypothetical protein